MVLSKLGKLYYKIGAFKKALGFLKMYTDLYAILDVPDNVTMAALSLMVSAAGTATSKVTVLLSPEEIGAAAQVSASYRPPGA